MDQRIPSLRTTPALPLDAVSEWRAWQALAVYFTVLLNRQLRRRWQLEQKCMQDRPVAQRFRPVFFLEPIPVLHPPCPRSADHKALATLKSKVRLLRARVEKGKELAAEIDRRLRDGAVAFPTHFCHTCVVGGDVADILLTKCGHRVCRTCLGFGVGADGVYECSICFAPTSFVARSPLSALRACSEEMACVSRRVVSRAGGGQARGGSAAAALLAPLVKPK
ncbi:uncharacterized protein N7459_007174 [Penicillium hispanicum]|uniref:uncharacterized protein n=1 Tax=Penicillium hispanicum TaxID=1080232 RepID=UPI0025419F01|nr:uncharacterized protein N7459_007174 [Penicillium hispanicum]KAJ5578210.1 hypothetical protein N7459_007174 [Penicillium hispanicum]